MTAKTFLSEIDALTEPTVFERCVEAADKAHHTFDAPDYAQITRVVLTALAEHTGSPRTVDEVMRVLGESA